MFKVTRKVAAANGCADKIEFLEELSNRVILPVRADVILAELRGVLPLFQRHVPAIVDARRRFLAPGGTMIPRKDTLWAAIVEAPKPYGEAVAPWDRNPFGQNLSPARQLAVNDVQKVHVSSCQLWTGHRLCPTLGYASCENPDARGTFGGPVGTPVHRTRARAPLI